MRTLSRLAELVSASAGPAIPRVPDSLRKTLIVGLGKVTGGAVAAALLDTGRQVRVAEGKRSPETERTAAGLARLGVEVVFDDRDLSLAEWADLVVPSPGVPPSNALLLAAAEQKIPIWSEIELGWRFAQGPVIAITGTNGKTTTTELLTRILTESSLPAAPAGNIGFPLVEVARSSDAGTILVTEVSSFQLAYVDEFRPLVAVVLNVADDHLDWHEDARSYLAAKARITENQGAADILFVSSHNRGALSIARGSRAQIGVFGVDPPAVLRERIQGELGRDPVLVAGISRGEVVFSSAGGETSIMRVSDIRLAGRHNLENVLAAGAAAFYLKCSSASISRGVHDFEALPHRMKVVGEKDGITYIDDSKATNPHAALAALKGLENVVLIAGGRSKGISLQPLEAGAPSCKGVVVMGEAATELKKVFRRLPVRQAKDVEDAVKQAEQMAEPGDIVLLSPGCSSLDQYSSYAERGDRFTKAVGRP